MAAEGIGFSAGSIFLQVVPSFRGFEAGARAVARDMGKVVEDELNQGGQRGGDRVAENMKKVFGDKLGDEAKKGGRKAGDDFGGAFETALRKHLDGALRGIGKTGLVSEELHSIKRELEGMKSQRIGVDIDARDALLKLNELERRAKMLSVVDPDIDIRTNAGRVSVEIEALNRLVSRLDGRNIKLDVDVNDKATQKLSAFNRLIGRSGNQAEDTANSFRAFSGAITTVVLIGPALVPIIAAITGGLIGLGVALVAITAGLGVFALGFFGIIDAVKALDDAQKNSGKDQEAYAKKIRNAADQVIDAQKRLRRAREDAVDSTEDAKRRTERAVADEAQANEDAARRVIDARKNAASAVQDALERQSDAEGRLADAQRDATDAQRKLREERAAAQKDLEDIAAKQRQNELDERQAVVDLFNATVNENAVRLDPGSTNLEKEQASINLEQARLRLDNIRKEQDQLKKDRAGGVEGTDRVKQAEDRVASALKTQRTAAEDLAKASKQLNETRVEGAQRVNEALEAQRRTQVDGAESVADAVRAQRRAQEDAAEAISDAQVNLTRAQKDYADALYETGEVGSASAQKLKDAFGVLSPAGQEFAKFIFSIKDDFLEVVHAIQEGLLPGLTEAMKIIGKEYGPDIKDFARVMGKTLGDLAVQAAKVFTSPAWRAFFDTFVALSPQIMRDFGTALLAWMTVFAQIAVETAPFAAELVSELAKLSLVAVRFMASAKGQKLWQDFLGFVEKVGPDVVAFFEALVPAFVKVVEALAPYGDIILKALTGILGWIASLDPKTIQAIVTGILTLVAAFQLASGAVSLFAFAAAAVSSPLGIIVSVLVLVAGALIYLYTTNEHARRIINEVLPAIGKLFEFVFKYIVVPALMTTLYIFDGMVKGIRWAWDNILAPTIEGIKIGFDEMMKFLQPVFKAIGDFFSDAGHAIKWTWDNVIWPVLKTFGTIIYELSEFTVKNAINGIKSLWNGLGTAFKWVWDKWLGPVFGWISKALGIDDKGNESGSGLVKAFRSAVGFIESIWDKLIDIAKKPVKFLIETVMNNGVISGFNWLADKLGMTKIDPIPIPKGFQSGGVAGVRPGYTPGRDTHAIMVSGGEGILVPELTRALGPAWINAANKRARRDGTIGAARFLAGYANGGIAWPVAGARPGTPFGKAGPMWSSGYHTGQDFPAPSGSPIHAVLGGRVTSAAWSSWGGNLMKILVAGLGQMLYAHQSAFAVREGDNVSTGQLIGYVGDTGNTTGPHLHLELRVGGRAVDPMRLWENGGRGVNVGAAEERSTAGKLLDKLGALSSVVKTAVTSPAEWIRGKFEGPLNKMREDFGDNFLTQMLGRIPEKLLDGFVSKIKAAVPKFSDGADEVTPYTGNQTILALKTLARTMLAKRGWGDQWGAFDWLVSHESGWNPKAQNPNSTAFGLGQFLNGTWSTVGGEKTADPHKQLEYMMRYISKSYGDPEGAKSFWEKNHYYGGGGVVPENLASVPTDLYDSGGIVPEGFSGILNKTGAGEHAAVFTTDQWERIGNAEGAFTYSPTFIGTDLTPSDVTDDILFTYRRIRAGGRPGGRPR